MVMRNIYTLNLGLNQLRQILWVWLIWLTEEFDLLLEDARAKKYPLQKERVLNWGI